MFQCSFLLIKTPKDHSISIPIFKTYIVPINLFEKIYKSFFQLFSRLKWPAAAFSITFTKPTIKNLPINSEWPWPIRAPDQDRRPPQPRARTRSRSGPPPQYQMVSLVSNTVLTLFHPVTYSSIFGFGDGLFRLFSFFKLLLLQRTYQLL